MRNDLDARRNERLLQRPGDRATDEHVHRQSSETSGPSQDAGFAQRLVSPSLLDAGFDVHQEQIA